MKTLAAIDILRAEHEAIRTAITEWIGMEEKTAMQDIMYLTGVNDVTCKLLEMMNDG